MSNFFDNVYDFIAKKFRMIFALVGFAAFGASIFFTFIGGLIDNGAEILHYLLFIAFYGLILAGLIIGYFKKNKPLLFASFICFLVTTIDNGLVSDSWGTSYIGDTSSAYILLWIFRLIFDIAVVGYLVLIILVNAFRLRKLEKVSHYVFLGIIPAGLLYWIFGIVYATNDGSWTYAIVPLFTCASMLFIPAALAISDNGEEETSEPSNEEEVESEQVEEKEVVEPEVEEEPKEE